MIKYHSNYADVAQLVEQLIRNQQVTGSSPVISSIEKKHLRTQVLFFKENSSLLCGMVEYL